MAGILSTSIFLKFQNKFKERCVTLFVEAYQISRLNKSISLDFEENDITTVLHSHIGENPKRKKWQIFTNREEYVFDKTASQVKGFASKLSRIDMRFSKFWEAEDYQYYVEAKNLKTKDSGLKRRYIKTGIDNFLAGGKYYNCEGFLVGYVLEGSVENCVEGINKLLEKDKRSNEKIEMISFLSKHQEKEIYHLFLDYAN